MPLKAPDSGGASCLYRRAALVSGNTQDLLFLSEICPHHRRTLLHPHTRRPRAPLRPTTGFAPFSAKPTESASRPRWPASCPSGALLPGTHLDDQPTCRGVPHRCTQVRALRVPTTLQPLCGLRSRSFTQCSHRELTPDLSARPRAQGTSPPQGGLRVALGHFSSLPWGALGQSVEGGPGGPRKAFPACLAGCSPHVHCPGHHAPALRGAGRVPRTPGIPHPEQCQGPPVPQTPDVIPKHKLEPDVRAGPAPSRSPHISEPVWPVPASVRQAVTALPLGGTAQKGQVRPDLPRCSANIPPDIPLLSRGQPDRKAGEAAAEPSTSSGPSDSGQRRAPRPGCVRESRVPGRLSVGT